MVQRTATGEVALSLDATAKNTPDNHGSASLRRNKQIVQSVLSSGVATDQLDRAWERPDRTLLSGIGEEIDLFDFTDEDVGFGAGNDRVGQPLVVDKIVSVVIKVESGTGSLEVTPGNNNGWTPIGIHTVANGGAIEAGGVIVKHLSHADGFAVTDGSSNRIRFVASGGDLVYSVYIYMRSPDYLPIDTDDLRMWMRSDIGALTGGARTFLASNLEYFSVADTADLDFGTGDFTIECWAKRRLDSAAHVILSKGAAAGASYQLRITAGDAVEAIARDTASQVTHTTTTLLNDTDWHHIVWVGDRSGNSIIYIDGVLASGGTELMSGVNLNMDNADALEIGRDRAGTAYGDGDIARVRIWKGRALAAIDAAYLYNSGGGLLHSDLGSSLETSLVAAYDMIEASGNAVDRVNAYTGTDTATVTAADGPGVGTPVNNDMIRQWNDRSLNARVLEQATIAKRPLYIASAINSLPGIRFDGTDDFLRLVENYFLKGVGTVVVAYQLTAAVQDDQTLFSVSDQATNVHRISFRGYNVAATPQINIIQTDNDTADNVRGSTAIVAATTYIAVFSSSGTAYTLRVNGVAETKAVITGADTGDWFSDLTGADNAVLGALVSNSEQDHLKGDIAEVAVFDHELTAAEISLIESYLATRYGVTLP